MVCTCWFHMSYRKVASSNMSRLEAHVGFFRLLMKGIFNPYVQWSFDKKLIFWLATSVRTRDYTVCQKIYLIFHPFIGNLTTHFTTADVEKCVWTAVVARRFQLTKIPLIGQICLSDTSYFRQITKLTEMIFYFSFGKQVRHCFLLR